MAKIKEVEEELYILYYDGKPLHLAQERWNEWKPTKKSLLVHFCSKNRYCEFA